VRGVFGLGQVPAAEHKYKIKSWGGSAVNQPTVAPKADPTKYPIKSFGADGSVKSVDLPKAAPEVAKDEAKSSATVSDRPAVASEASSKADPVVSQKTQELKSALKKIAEIRGKILASENKISKALHNASRDEQMSDARLVNLTKAVDLYGKILSLDNEIATLLKKIASEQESIVDRIAALDKVTELYDNVSVLENQVNKLL
jgi:hypothetical protein